jgi:hypothetical protein
MASTVHAGFQQADGQHEEQDHFDGADFDVQRYVNNMFPTGDLPNAVSNAEAAAAAQEEQVGRSPAAPNVPLTNLCNHGFVAEASLVELDPLMVTLKQKVWNHYCTTCLIQITSARQPPPNPTFPSIRD